MAQQLAQLMQPMYEEQQQRRMEWQRTDVAAHTYIQHQMQAQNAQIQTLQQQVAEVRAVLITRLQARAATTAAHQL
jgi:polyhydroxyalkanoate synthesis regulator phasin